MRPKDFDNLHDQLFSLSLKGYIALTHDLQIPVDKASVIEVWKKSSKNN